MGFPFLLPAPRFAKCTIQEYRIPYHHFERMPTSAPSTAFFQRKEGECRFSCIAISSERAALLFALCLDFSLFLPKAQVPCYNG